MASEDLLDFTTDGVIWISRKFSVPTELYGLICIYMNMFGPLDGSRVVNEC